MFNDIINLLHLERQRNEIESLETRLVDRELYVELKFKKKNLSCPICSSKTSFHDYRPKKITYSISTTKACYINYKQRRYRCDVCEKRFLEESPFSPKYEKIGLLTKMNVLDHLKMPANTFSSAAHLYHISIKSVINIFDSFIDAKRRRLPEVISIDEFYKARNSKYKYACLLYDFKDKKIIDVITTRQKHYLTNYFGRIPLEERKRVKYVIIDMWETYRDVSEKAFPNALIAIDSFHLIKDLNEKVRRIRIDTMHKYHVKNTSLEANDMYYYMLKKFHYFFVKNFESITTKKIVIPKLRTAWYKETIMDYLLHIDPLLKEVYELKEKYRYFNLTASFETCDDELSDLIQAFRNHPLEEMRSFGKTLSHWKAEIKNSLIRINGKRLSNGPIEGINSQVKTIIKSSAGIKNFYRLRNRIMYSINKDIPLSNNDKWYKNTGK